MVEALQILVLTSSTQSPPLLAQTQDRAKRQIRIESVKISPNILHLNEKKGPTCGTATVRVAVGGKGNLSPPNPRVVVSVAEASSDPPGVTVSVAHAAVVSLGRGGTTVEETLTTSTTDVSFRVCATGEKTGDAIFAGVILGVAPASDFSVAERSPVTGQTKFAVRK